MSAHPFMQMYWADYFGDTRHLTCEQHGAYLQLIGTMWLSGGRLSSDPRLLAKITNCTTSRWSKISTGVMAFFEVDGQEIVHARIEYELEKARDKSIKRAEAGSRGGLAKSLKTQIPRLAIAAPLLKHLPEPEPDGEANASPAAFAALPADETVGKPRSNRRAPETTIADGFPDADAIALGGRRCDEAGVIVHIEQQARKFRTHALTSDRRCRNWKQAWRGWVDIAIDSAPVKPAVAAATVAQVWAGPETIKAMIARHPDGKRLAAYLDRCTYQTDPKAILSTSGHLADTLRSEVGKDLADLGVTVIQIAKEPAA